MKAFERVAEYNVLTKEHRIVDIDRFGRECESSKWRPDTTATQTVENWEDALFCVSNYRADSRIQVGDVLSFRRYL